MNLLVSAAPGHLVENQNVQKAAGIAQSDGDDNVAWSSKGSYTVL